MTDSYLWNKSGTPDADVERLEAELSTFRLLDKTLDLTRLASVPTKKTIFWRRWQTWALSAVAAIVVVGGIFLLTRPEPIEPPSDWQIQASAPITINGSARSSAALHLGNVVETGSASATLRVADIGEVELGPNSSLKIVESQKERRRLSLTQGTMRARIFAPPAVFVVDTPAARAVDLGCVYDLTVAKDGAGTLTVQTGWVMIDREFMQSVVPAQAQAFFDRDGNISPPIFRDSPEQFRAAVLRLTLNDPSGSERRRALAEIVQSAQLRESYTLINLFRRLNPEERGIVFDRLNQLIPAPAGVTRAAVVADWKAPEKWWRPILDKLGIPQFNKKGSLRLGIYDPI